MNNQEFIKFINKITKTDYKYVWLFLLLFSIIMCWFCLKVDLVSYICFVIVFILLLGIIFIVGNFTENYLKVFNNKTNMEKITKFVKNKYDYVLYLKTKSEKDFITFTNDPYFYTMPDFDGYIQNFKRDIKNNNSQQHEIKFLNKDDLCLEYVGKKGFEQVNPQYYFMNTKKFKQIKAYKSENAPQAFKNIFGYNDHKKEIKIKHSFNHDNVLKMIKTLPHITNKKESKNNNMKQSSTFNDKLNKAMSFKKVNKAKLADKLNLSQSELEQYLNNNYINKRFIHQVADVLNLPYQYFVTELDLKQAKQEQSKDEYIRQLKLENEILKKDNHRLIKIIAKEKGI